MTWDGICLTVESTPRFSKTPKYAETFLILYHLVSMNPAFMVVANQSFSFNLYDLHLEGLTAKELAKAYSIALFRVEEHLEAVRLSLKYQVKLTVGVDHAVRPLAA